MAINLPSSIIVTSKQPIDVRLLLSKEEMLNINEARMPDKYFALCKDDEKLYIFNSSNQKDSLTGKFRLYSANIENLPIAIKKMLTEQTEKNSGLVVDDNNSLKLNVNEEQFQIKDNKLDLAINLIQAQ